MKEFSCFFYLPSFTNKLRCGTAATIRCVVPGYLIIMKNYWIIVSNLCFWIYWLNHSKLHILYPLLIARRKWLQKKNWFDWQRWFYIIHHHSDLYWLCDRIFQNSFSITAMWDRENSSRNYRIGALDKSVFCKKKSCNLKAHPKDLWALQEKLLSIF